MYNFTAINYFYFTAFVLLFFWNTFAGIGEASFQYEGDCGQYFTEESPPPGLEPLVKYIKKSKIDCTKNGTSEDICECQAGKIREARIDEKHLDGFESVQSVYEKSIKKEIGKNFENKMKEMATFVLGLESILGGIQSAEEESIDICQLDKIINPDCEGEKINNALQEFFGREGEKISLDGFTEKLKEQVRNFQRGVPTKKNNESTNYRNVQCLPVEDLAARNLSEINKEQANELNDSILTLGAEEFSSLRGEILNSLKAEGDRVEKIVNIINVKIKELRNNGDDLLLEDLLVVKKNFLTASQKNPLLGALINSPEFKEALESGSEVKVTSELLTGKSQQKSEERAKVINEFKKRCKKLKEQFDKMMCGKSGTFNSPLNIQNAEYLDLILGKDLESRDKFSRFQTGHLYCSALKKNKSPKFQEFLEENWFTVVPSSLERFEKERTELINNSSVTINDKLVSPCDVLVSCKDEEKDCSKRISPNLKNRICEGIKDKTSPEYQRQKCAEFYALLEKKPPPDPNLIKMWMDLDPQKNLFTNIPLASIEEKGSNPSGSTEDSQVQKEKTIIKETRIIIGKNGEVEVELSEDDKKKNSRGSIVSHYLGEESASSKDSKKANPQKKSDDSKAGLSLDAGKSSQSKGVEAKKTNEVSSTSSKKKIIRNNNRGKSSVKERVVKNREQASSSNNGSGASSGSQIDTGIQGSQLKPGEVTVQYNDLVPPSEGETINFGDDQRPQGSAPTVNGPNIGGLGGGVQAVGSESAEAKAREKAQSALAKAGVNGSQKVRALFGTPGSSRFKAVQPGANNNFQFGSAQKSGGRFQDDIKNAPDRGPRGEEQADAEGVIQPGIYSPEQLEEAITEGGGSGSVSGGGTIFPQSGGKSPAGIRSVPGTRLVGGLIVESNQDGKFPPLTGKNSDPEVKDALVGLLSSSYLEAKEQLSKASPEELKNNPPQLVTALAFSKDPSKASVVIDGKIVDVFLVHEPGEGKADVVTRCLQNPNKEKKSGRIGERVAGRKAPTLKQALQDFVGCSPETIEKLTGLAKETGLPIKIYGGTSTLDRILEST